MFCVNCGSKLQGKFFQECGTPVGGVAPQMEQTNTSLSEVNEMIIKENLFS